MFGLGDLPHIWIINFLRIQFLELLFLDESPLVSEPLLGKILPASVCYFLLAAPSRLFEPVGFNFRIFRFNRMCGGTEADAAAVQRRVTHGGELGVAATLTQ